MILSKHLSRHWCSSTRIYVFRHTALLFRDFLDRVIPLGLRPRSTLQLFSNMNVSLRCFHWSSFFSSCRPFSSLRHRYCCQWSTAIGHVPSWEIQAPLVPQWTGVASQQLSAVRPGLNLCAYPPKIRAYGGLDHLVCVQANRLLVAQAFSQINSRDYRGLGMV